MKIKKEELKLNMFKKAFEALEEKAENIPIARIKKITKKHDYLYKQVEEAFSPSYSVQVFREILKQYYIALSKELKAD